jgi:hypothetical protein
MKSNKLFQTLIAFFIMISSCFATKQLEISNIELSGQDFGVKEKYNTEYQNNIISIHYKVLNSELGDKIYVRFGTQGLNSLKFGPYKVFNLGAPIKYKEFKAGNYKFELFVKGKNELSKTVSFEIKIERPWWRTWWFWGACFITIFGLFYGRERFLKFWADEEQRHHRQIVELELRTLQLQMNPHFVFNALNSIQSYVMTHDSLTANNYLSKFAHLIRLFLDSSRSKYISLSEEIRMLSLYIDMEKLRFESKFDYELTVDSEINKFIELPTMILQPFIENAINHGLRYKREKGYLKVHFYYENQYLICKIEDNGVGRKSSKEIQSKSSKGYNSQGLKITTERLLTFNKINETNITFTINDLYENAEEQGIDSGTLVEVKFPKIL